MISDSSRKKRGYKKKYTRKNRKGKIGGAAFSAGGYGCVFKPALTCANNIKNKNIKKKIGTVSKLLEKRNAFDEMQEIERVLKYIKRNPDNSKYFIINDQVSICTPAPLKKADLKNYGKICSGTKLDSLGITQKNINAHLDELNIINMVDGGEDLDNMWDTLVPGRKKNKKFNADMFNNINTHLIALLNNAIIKLNQEGLYHFDIKGSNILVGKDKNTRLIDWGTSFEFNNEHNHSSIPVKVYNRAIFQYNVPFSVILFVEGLEKIIANFIKNKNIGNLNKKNQLNLVKEIAEKIILHNLKENGSGHLELILEKMIIAYRDVLGNKNFTTEKAMLMIRDYLADILFNYLDFNTFIFDLNTYFIQVFLHNIDIYGFLTAYIELIMPDKTNKDYFHLVQEISKVLNDFCWSALYASKPISLQKLTDRLNELNIGGY